MEWRDTFNRFNPTEDLPHSMRVSWFSEHLLSALIILRAGTQWIYELGVRSEMPFYQKKSVALINRMSFLCLLLALPGSFMLLLVGYDHPFSLLVTGVLMVCLILALNGVQQVEWGKALFAFGPAGYILVYTLLELASNSFHNSLTYALARQAVCLALLLPLIIYGFEDRRKVLGVGGICVLIFLAFDLATIRLGAFQLWDDGSLNRGLFSVLSILQLVGIAACIFYMQSYTLNYEKQVQSMNEKLQRMAVTDGMTGLLNHTVMEQLIGDAINRTKRSHSPMSLIIIDVDFFKLINDTYGHTAGDEVLKRLSQVLDHSKRSTDYMGRWGGEEFILLLTETSLLGATKLAEKLRHLVESHTFPHRSRLTISLGVTEYKDGDTLVTFIKRADVALYRAKHSGRNRSEIQN